MKAKEEHLGLMKKPAGHPVPLGFYFIREAGGGDRKSSVFFEHSDFHQTNRYQVGYCPKPIAFIVAIQPLISGE